MHGKYGRMLTFAYLLAGVAAFGGGCNDDDTAGQGGGQISGDAKVVGEDLREQVPPTKGGGETAGTTPGAGDAGTSRSNVGTGSEGSEAGPVNSGSNQAKNQQNR